MANVDRYVLTPSQSKFFLSTARYLDLEGAVRSGKTTIAMLKALHWARDHPGIVIYMARWKEDDARAQIKPRLRELWPKEFLGPWNAEEHRFECRNGSTVYVRGLRPAEGDTRYSKFTGMTLAVIYIDQPEEMPADFFQAMKARLSQPGVPHGIWLTPNPPDEDHWIADAFRDDTEDEQKDGHQYIRTTVYDNRPNLPPGYIEDLERQYPPGHVLRLRWIEGRRGLSMVGAPVYAGFFSRERHVDPGVEFDRDLPLVEAYDFGHHHPAVLWSQFGLGEWRVLGELMGTDEFLETFLPRVLQFRQNHFPSIGELYACCDPAGTRQQSQGTRTTALDILHDQGIYPVFLEGANHPVARDGAIQKISQALSRLSYGGRPSVRLHPRCRDFIRGLEGGYVWADMSTAHTLYPNTRRPKKDGRYDHLQNCAEYSWLSFGPMTQTTADDIRRRQEADARRALRRAQVDIDEEDKDRAHGRRYTISRRGIL